MEIMSRYYLNRSSFSTVRPEHKCVESSHVSEVVEFGHVGEHVVEVVGVGRILTFGPPSSLRSYPKTT